MTTPAAFTPALAAWLATSSRDAAATLAIAATSSRRPISPTLIDPYSTSSGQEDRNGCPNKNPARSGSAPDYCNSTLKGFDQPAAARGARLRELRWKNSAWLATAETIAGWNGFEIRNAGSGRSPVRKRSGYAVMNTTGTSNVLSSSLTASSPELPSAS